MPSLVCIRGRPKLTCASSTRGVICIKFTMFQKLTTCRFGSAKQLSKLLAAACLRKAFVVTKRGKVKFDNLVHASSLSMVTRFLGICAYFGPCHLFQPVARELPAHTLPTASIDRLHVRPFSRFLGHPFCAVYRFVRLSQSRDQSMVKLQISFKRAKMSNVALRFHASSLLIISTEIGPMRTR